MGIAIGLLVVAVATSALMISRGVSGTVSDASGIQQQAAYALRQIGGQLRQTSSLGLNLNPTNAVGVSALAPVAFERRRTGSSNPDFDFDLNNAEALLSGEPQSLTIGYRRDRTPVFTSTDLQTLARNCIGGPGSSGAPATYELVQSVFQLSGNQLTCSGNGAIAQPIVQNVANFQVRYLSQDVSVLGNPQVQYVDADTAEANWGQVQGIEVCLVLYGTEPIDMPAGSTYTDCDGSTLVDMTTLTGVRAKRMHMVFRNVFQLRSQGLV